MFGWKKFKLIAQNENDWSPIWLYQNNKLFGAITFAGTFDLKPGERAKIEIRIKGRK